MDNLHKFSKNKLIKIIEIIDSLLGAENEPEFNQIIDRLGEFTDFEASVCTISEYDENKMEETPFVLNTSYPKSFMTTYMDEKFHNIDPVLNKYLVTQKPLIWSEVFKNINEENEKVVSLAYDHNLFEGLSYGSFEENSNIFSMIFTGGKKRKIGMDSQSVLTFVYPHIHESLKRISGKRGRTKKERQDRFTIQEIEILNWIKEGKSNWEISMIMNITERTVKYHVSKLLKKLDAVNRGHAVAKAMEIKIISV